MRAKGNMKRDELYKELFQLERKKTPKLEQLPAKRVLMDIVEPQYTAKEKIIGIARRAGYGIDDRKDKIIIYL